MNVKVLLAVFKRNFVSYFANPTGYVFICVFVVLSSSAAFLPDEFFNTNLANLDQLNRWFPFIMLVFIPAITMAAWADERRQGTDELLLTIPASDFDIVLGKYLAAVTIYSVSLLFSLVCNLWVLETLGSPDKGLFVATYIGYWFVGLAMLAVGMVASFLTANLTIAYILGAVFNVPLVFFVWAQSVFGRHVGLAVKQWSINSQFADFGRGILDFSHLVYFLSIAAVMLYLSVVFIGRRHWRSGASSLPHYALYVVQVLAFFVIGANLCLLGQRGGIRGDVTAERLSSLSRNTVKLLKGLEIEQPVQIEAFVSPEVPEAYVQTRLNLLSMLQELKARGGKKVTLRLNYTERFSEEAARAEQRYDITARRVVTLQRGTLSEDYIFLGVAFNCGLEKVILPFVDRGIPVEYELARSIATVTQQKRKRIGVLQTDAQLSGQFTMMGTSPNWPILDELKKQYEVVEVDATGPITERYDALLAVQPSSLGPEQMDNFIAAVNSGQPTAIFEDPFPIFADNVPGTDDPRRPPGGMNPMMGRQQPPPKGDIRGLWALLGVSFGNSQIVWQDHNPYPKLNHLPKEFVFVDSGQGDQEPFKETEAVSSKLQHMLFPCPGSVSKLNTSDFEFTPLVRTGESTGTTSVREMRSWSPFGPGGINPNRRQVPQDVSYVVAAQIQGKLPADEPTEEEDSGKEKEEAEAEAKKPQENEINVIVVSDIDMLHREFFLIREQGDVPGGGLSLDFDNVTFVLNALDALADDDRFMEIRKRRPQYRTLTQIERRTEDARRAGTRTREDLQKKFDDAVDKAQKDFDKAVEELQQQLNKEDVGANEILIRVAMAQQNGEKRLNAERDRLKQELDRKINKIETDLSLEIRRVQNTYKMWSVLMPPILPLVLAVFVFFTRRAKEREGVARSRLRS